jgi:Flp pilus assembly protein TadD
MSLIIDALKRAQQLRLSGAEESPTLNYPYPKKKTGRRSKKQWIPVGAGLISLCIVLLVLLRPASSPLATQTNRAIDSHRYVGAALSGRPSSGSVAQKISSEPPKEVLGPAKDEEPLPPVSSAKGDGPQADQTLNPVNSRTESGKAINPGHDGTGSGQARPQVSLNAGAPLSEHPSHPQEEKKSAETTTSSTEKKGGPLKKQAPPPLAAQKENKPLKSIGVEQEGGKSGTLASDVLNHFNSGVTFYNQREFSKAIQAYQKVIELDPAYVEAYNNLGIIYQMTGDLDRAFGAYQKATEINPMYEKGYNNLGILLLLKGRDEKALEAFQKALSINPNNIETYINLGTLFKKKGQWDEAIESYQKALAIDPLHGETHYNMALLYEQMENLELAISYYQQFIRLSSRSHPELVSRVQNHLNDLMKAKNR